MDEQAAKRARDEAAGAAPVVQTPVLPYRTRFRPVEPLTAWAPLDFIAWPSSISEALVEAANLSNCDPVLASEHAPELWRCDADGAPLPGGKVAVRTTALLGWTAAMTPRPAALDLLLQRNASTGAPGAFVLFTLPPARPTVPAAALENTSTAQPPFQSFVQVYDTLEELILALGGMGEKGALQLNVLSLKRGPLATEFRGRTNELKQFAGDVQYYRPRATSDRAEDHPYFVATALPGTGKTTFGRECLARLPEYLQGNDAELVRNGVTIYLNLNGDEASWKLADKQLDLKSRFVARIVATVFLNSGYEPIWKKFHGLLCANALQLSFHQLVSLIAKAQRLRKGLAPDAKVAALFVLDDFQVVGADLQDLMRPILTSMGSSTCYDTAGILVLPLLTGTWLEGARAMEVLGGHKRKLIYLEPFTDSDVFAILRELLLKLGPRLPSALLDYFAPALNATRPIDTLPSRQLSFRVLVLDCSGNPSLLAHLAGQLATYCSGDFRGDSSEFLDNLFLSFNKPGSYWLTKTASLRSRIAALPTSLVPTAIASLPIRLNGRAVGDQGEAMEQTWSELLSSCGLTPMPHPSFSLRSMIQMPYFFLHSLVGSRFVPLEACVDFPYLHRSGQAFEDLVFKVHAQRTFHLLGKSALAIPNIAFQRLFPGGFIPNMIAECLVRLPDETAVREGGPQLKTEDGWCHDLKGTPCTVDDIPPAALTGDVFKTTSINHYHFDGRSALTLYPDASPRKATVLLLWQIKLSQPRTTTAFGVADIRQWHEKARALTLPWANARVKVVFVLVLFRKLSAATDTENAKTVCDEVRGYVEASGDLVVVTMEHMGEYLAGLSHRLYVPLEPTSTAAAV